MPLSPGTRLGPYEIVAPLGAGGMGEVYRARDTRLGRDVAVKVLPAHLAETPDARQRFEREARAISQLNHPHICVLHDVGREGELDYLVMELVDGETLAQRLAKGPLPMDQLLKTGVEIADALDRAHRAGIVHRDLKPGNVMLTRSGAKLMDFGLARWAPAEGGSTLGPAPSDLTRSPTLTRPLTAEGHIVGTFQYMAPEQLEGQEADTRSDLWALGAVLYEMATGRPAFEGKSQASLIGAIMTSKPAALSTLVPMAPPALDRLVHGCLEKDPENRWQSAGDVRRELQWISQGGSLAGVPAPVAQRRREHASLAWGIAALLGAVAIALGVMWVARRPEPPQVMRFAVPAPDGVTGISWPRISPDGSRLAFLANDSTGTRRVWVRRLDALEARPLAAADGNTRPFWSPDGRFLAFISDGRLRKVPIDGGPPVPIADIPGGFDGSWGSRNLILFDGSFSDSIRVVSATGGEAKSVSTIDRVHGETQHAWPFFLPDGRHYLYVAYKSNDPVGEIKFATIGTSKVLTLGRTDGRVEYAPPGYLIYPSGNTLVAQAIDVRSGKISGDPVPVGENVSVSSGSGDFSVSSQGIMAYRVQKGAVESELAWVDRNGRTIAGAAPLAAYRDVALSPDGSRVVVGIATGRQASEDLWVRDLNRGVSSRLTFDAGSEIWPVWSRDGNRIAYGSNRGGQLHIMSKAASGVGSEDSIAVVIKGHHAPSDWLSDGRIVSTAISQSWDLVLHEADGRAIPLVQTSFHEREGRVSPDGRWLAYTSNESGRYEIYVVPFPGATGKWQISTRGGRYPYWRKDGREILYQAADQWITAVPVEGSDTFQVGTAQPLFRVTLNDAGISGPRWAPAGDGQRFLVNRLPGGSKSSELVVVTDWTADLKQK